MAVSRFIVSLDFELYWGLRDQRSVADYSANLAGARRAIEALLEVFSEFEIHATWATVGFVMLRGIDDIRLWSPETLPVYDDRSLSAYEYAWETPLRSDFHFAADLVGRIVETPNQELATHTFSHYYALERPGSLEAFAVDLRTALRIGRERFNCQLRSLVFPRNQYDDAHLRVAREEGIVAYRGTTDNWMYSPRRQEAESQFRRGARLVDAYLPVAGSRSNRSEIAGPRNVPASRFLRPWSRSLAALESLRIARITREISAAAARGRDYHLWWHPHNFGINLKENLGTLRQILNHAQALRRSGQLRFVTMAAAAEEAE